MATTADTGAATMGARAAAMAIDVLTGMRVFTTVVDLQSFAKAAEKLDLSRGMTSRYVAQVEAHLGVRLLHRTTRRLSLTEAGSDYYQRAAQVLADEARHRALQPRSLRTNHGRGVSLRSQL